MKVYSDSHLVQGPPTHTGCQAVATRSPLAHSSVIRAHRPPGHLLGTEPWASRMFGNRTEARRALAQTLKRPNVKPHSEGGVLLQPFGPRGHTHTHTHNHTHNHTHMHTRAPTHTCDLES